MGYIDLSNTAGEVIATIPVCEECKNKILAGQIERDSTVDRFDSYSQEEHAVGVEQARKRIGERLAVRRARAKAAVERLRHRA